MIPFQYLLFFLATVVFTLGVYYLVHVLFIYRAWDKYLFFSLTTLAAAAYIVAELVMTFPAGEATLLAWHRFKLGSLLVVVQFWLFTVCSIFLPGNRLPLYFSVVTIAAAVLVPTGLFVTAPVTHLAFEAGGIRFEYRFAATGIAYSAYAIALLLFFGVALVAVLRSRIAVPEKVIAVFSLLPGLIAGANDFAVTHGMWRFPMLAEFVFFVFLISVYIRFVREQHRLVGDLEQARRIQIEQERTRRELEIAAHIQTSILPRIPVLEEYDVSASMIPAEAAGGDYFDYERSVDGRHWFCIGDVSGHGLTPGLVMLMAQSAFRTALNLDPHGSPADMIGHMNRTLYGNIHDRLQAGFYMTCSLYAAEPGGIFHFAGAHQETLVYNAEEQSIDEMPVEGMWLGIVPEIGADTRQRVFRLRHGDALILYTDGITEARNPAGEQYGLARFEEQILLHGEMGADELRLHLLEDLYGFMARQADDITLYVIKRR